MASTKYTGKFKVGQSVTYAYFAAAISAGQNGRIIRGSARIAGTQKANGTTMYVMDDDKLVFEQEIADQ